MKNRFKLLGLLPALCLSACNNGSYYGTYEFRLGKTDGSHLGLTAKMLKEKYEKRKGYEKLTLSAELGQDFSIEKLVESYEEEYPLIAIFLEDFVKKLENVSSIYGYYAVNNEIKNEKYGRRVSIGSDYITEFLEEAYPEIFDDPDFNIAPELFEMFVCAYVNSTTFTFQIPVSLADMQQQLFWYGYFLDLEGLTPYTALDVNLLPGEKGEERIGTHPQVKKDKKGNIVDDQVATINETFKFDFSHTYLYNAEEKPIGSFAVKENEQKQQVLYYKPFEGETTSPASGHVYTKSILGIYDDNKNINFDVDTTTGEVKVNYNHKEGKDEGFTDKDGTEFTFPTLMKKAFVFRDYHDVKVGLTKV